MAKIMKQEWQGVQIEIINSLNRVELKVDGKTQDFYEGFFSPQELILKGKGKKGEKIKVVFKPVFRIFTKYYIYFGEQLIKKGIVK